VTAGAESFWLRDVARTGPPVDASPVSWEGQGPVVYVSHDRGSRARLHHFEVAFTATSGFELRSPVRTTPAPDEDGVSRWGGRYEYRRYRWRDLWTKGFDLGVGVEGSAERLSLERHFEPDIELRRTINQLGTAIVVAARWQRSERWSLRSMWANGVTLGRATVEYRGGADTTGRDWGGGWRTDFEVGGDFRIASQARVTAAWFTSGEGRFESHDALTFGRSRVTVGVTYAR
jgi:hypothetical protein